jgi:hypothetical protein
MVRSKMFSDLHHSICGFLVLLYHLLFAFPFAFPLIVTLLICFPPFALEASGLHLHLSFHFQFAFVSEFYVYLSDLLFLICGPEILDVHPRSSLLSNCDVSGEGTGSLSA